jgi:hypothetical protein
MIPIVALSFAISCNRPDLNVEWPHLPLSTPVGRIVTSVHPTTVQLKNHLLQQLEKDGLLSNHSEPMQPLDMMTIEALSIPSRTATEKDPDVAMHDTN